MPCPNASTKSSSSTSVASVELEAPGNGGSRPSTAACGSMTTPLKNSRPSASSPINTSTSNSRSAADKLTPLAHTGYSQSVEWMQNLRYKRSQATC